MKNKKEFKQIHNNVQKEALINEIKGNLFEYLVAHICAKRLNIEAQFLTSFSGEMKKMMTSYEKWLRENDRELILKLQNLAIQTAQKLSEYIVFITDKSGAQIDSIYVIGKMSGGFHNDQFKEADLLFCAKEKTYPVSLKLSKKNAFVNTKSAGAKSFIKKYFQKYSNSNLIQATFDGIVDKLFSEMGSALYERRSLVFATRFDSRWVGADLPGELEGEDQKDLYKMYRSLSKNLYDILKELHAEDEQKFISCISPLLGGGSIDLISVTCFHHETRKNQVSSKYEYSHVEIKDFQNGSNEIRFLDFKEKTASFDIAVGKSILQVRIKPMNKFTTPSYKVNCSVKNVEED